MVPGALIPGRVMIMRSAAEAIKKALTIAIRYSAVRRQFPSADDPNVEEKILDYQTHKHNLMPMLATTYAVCRPAVGMLDSNRCRVGGTGWNNSLCPGVSHSIV